MPLIVYISIMSSLLVAVGALRCPGVVSRRIGLAAVRHASTKSVSSTPLTLTELEKSDQRFMKLAIRQAQHGYREEEVPIGAVVVDKDGRVLATARNKVEELCDATAHAEINAMRQAAELTKSWRLLDCTLYTTLEPCAMCLSAAHSFRLRRIVYAAKDLRLGACGSWINLHENKHPMHYVEITGGVLEEESALLLRRFFASLRSNNKSKLTPENITRGITSEMSA